MRPSTLCRRELLESMVSEMEACVHALSRVIETPTLVDDKAFIRAFRHRDKNDLLASFLKVVRITSCLNAALVLLREGYVQEVFVLCRAVDEAAEDVQFLAQPLGDNGPSKDQVRFINEFFQEEFTDADDPVKSRQKRDRVSRKTIHAALSRSARAPFNPSDAQQLVQTLNQAVSGYVHGAYGHIMDMYGGSPATYHTKGMLGTPRIKTCEEQLTSYVYRSLLATEVVARRTEQHDVARRLTELSIRLGRETGCLSEEGIQRAMKRLNLRQKAV